MYYPDKIRKDLEFLKHHLGQKRLTKTAREVLVQHVDWMIQRIEQEEKNGS